MNMSKSFLTAKEVAAFLRVSPRTISRWCREGAFPGAIRIAGDGPWRIPCSAVDAFIGAADKEGR